ncbi:hypothetical protein BSZ37_18745 [Rubrivirga marina]|uniref:Glycosyl hydrolase-like 10 domain-containing protein n=2 Tax=Rubrivirga marina TaxID=1196024 RepID=A0A271J5R7_9BACT|nr:hypothetical protein BSZ37_18745 [Rubrivirga marina]
MRGGEVVDAATLPGPDREFRAAWIATVANIDWPSDRSLSTAEQKAELTQLLDRAKALGLNAVVFQVRPAADALYFSAKEPWSEYLTGRQGRAPEPWYDPLQLAIDEAHARGLELHAWFNPYRAGHPAGDGPRDMTHISRQRPDLVREYGDYLWLDPGEPEAADHSLSVILDVVRRYDVDGVHLDDYFYPYPVNRNGRRVQFPDAGSYARAQAAGETLGRDDWRRQNVDTFIQRLYDEVKTEKPHVLVGISPFGIWRPGNPASVTGFDQYAEIYADARKWWREGWLDYLAPQLYWSIDSRGQSFPALLDWWGEQNVRGRHLWPGLYDSRVLPDVGGYRPQEIVNQVELVRRDPEATGTIHFSMKALLDRYSSLGGQLAAGPYAEPALVPASPWLDATAPAAPRLSLTRRGDAADVIMLPGDGETVRQWVVRARRGGRWSWELVPTGAGTYVIPGDRGRVEAVAVSAVGLTGAEGPARVVEL